MGVSCGGCGGVGHGIVYGGTEHHHRRDFGTGIGGADVVDLSEAR